MLCACMSLKRKAYTSPRVATTCHEDNSDYIFFYAYVRALILVPLKGSKGCTMREFRTRHRKWGQSHSQRSRSSWSVPKMSTLSACVLDAASIWELVCEQAPKAGHRAKRTESEAERATWEPVHTLPGSEIEVDVSSLFSRYFLWFFFLHHF